MVWPICSEKRSWFEPGLIIVLPDSSSSLDKQERRVSAVPRVPKFNRAPVIGWLLNSQEVGESQEHTAKDLLPGSLEIELENGQNHQKALDRWTWVRGISAKRVKILL